jgi:hypothetical protein
MKTKKKAAKKAVKKVAPKVEPQVEAAIPAPEPASEPLEVTVIVLANNPRYVYASLDGERIAVEVPAWMSPRLVRKPIKVHKKIDSEHYELHGN